MVQVLPSLDRYASNRSPVRTSRTHPGAVPVPPVFGLIAERGPVDDAELWEVFNMGCGFCVVVPSADGDAAIAVLSKHHTGSALIGQITAQSGVVELPSVGLVGRKDQGFRAT